MLLLLGMRVCPQTHIPKIPERRRGEQEVCGQTCEDEGMQSRSTPVQAPIALRIADELRIQIERGDLSPGQSLPTLAELCQRYDCSMNSARGAIALLKAQGLIVSGRGKAPTVRIPPRRAVRDSERHQIEKDLAVKPESERALVGEAETNFGMSIDEQEFDTVYDVTEAGPEIGEALAVAPSEPVLRRQWQSTDPRTGHLLSSSVSFIPKALVEANPALFDADNEPWPGGTMHQLSTVGMEIMKVVDVVTARMPTTVEAQMWDLPDGVPLIFCRRISYDAAGRPIEVSDADYPADRTELRFTTPLKPWTESPK
jgi:GntR family transcriptional regulator